jgi:hypothetical protein
MTRLFHYESNPEDDEERNGKDLVKIQLRLQAEGQHFDKISLFLSLLIPLLKPYP